MERFSTEILRSARKAEAWNDIYSGTLAAADFIPAERNFSAGLSISQLGDLELARLATGRCTIRRTAAHIDRSVPRLYSVIIQANGRGFFTQGGNRALLQTGDFALCDHGLPHSRVLDSGAETLLIRIPADLIADYLPAPDLLCGLRLPGSAGLAASAAVLARSLWANMEQGFSSRYENCLAHHLLELIATSYTMQFGSAARDEPDCEICGHLEDNLHDPRFKAGSLASELGLSEDELRRRWGDGPETSRAYLLRRRLEEAARRLRDPRWAGHTIAEIAYCCGFSGNAMFSRCFRARYDVSPTQYRES